MMTDQLRTTSKTAKSRGLRRSRARKSCSGEAVIELCKPGESPREINAKLVDVSDFGAGFETSQPLEVGARITISSLFFDSRAEIGRRAARIVHCTLRAGGAYRSGASFDNDETAGGGDSLEDQAARAASGLFVDYYEVLQISPHAGVEMIERAHAVLIERYLCAPEGVRKETSRRLVDEAHRVLSDPVLRAAYDVKHRRRAPHWQIFGEAGDQAGGDDELVIRRAILSLLYAARKKQGGPEGLTPKELEDLLLCPREHLEFSLWYLRGKGHVGVTGHERYAITPSGVDAAEGNEEAPAFVLLELASPLSA
jgi:hypothetical protein